MKPELAQLIALQKNDNRIKYLKNNIATVPQRRADIESDFARRASEIKVVEDRRAVAQQERVRLEAEIAENQAHAIRSDRNLMAAQKTDEYSAAIREADTARKNIVKLEEQLLEQMGIIEEADAILAERAPEITRLRAELKKNLAAFTKLIQQEEAEILVCEKERATMRQEVAPATLRIYERLVTRLRDGIAVAEVRNGACSSCFMSVRPQAMSDLRAADQINTCEHCTRILYIAQD